ETWSLEHLEIDCLGHRTITRIVRMQIVARLIRAAIPSWVLRVAHDLFEIDHTVERPAGTNPFIDGCAHCLAFGMEVHRVLIGQNGATQYFQSPSVGACDELFV